MRKNRIMELNNFEKHLKTSLHNMEEEVDVAKLMKAIQPIEPKRKKKGLYIASVVAVMVLLAGSSYYLTPSNTSTDKALSVLTTDLSHDQNELNNESSEYPSAPVKKEQFSEQYQLVDRNVELSESESRNYIQHIEQATSNIYEIHKTKRSVQQSLEDSRNGSTNFLGSRTKTTITDRADVSKNGYQLAVRQNVESTTKDINLVQSTKLKSLGMMNLETESDINLKLISPKQVDCPTFVENPWIFDFGTVMGLSNPTKSLTKKTTEILPAYASRATNEKSLEGLDLELYISAKRARWPVFLKSGINYSRWSERMKIEEDYTEIDTIQGIISITTSETGDTVKYIYGDIYVERDVQIRQSIHYYINRIDIPLSVVYEKEYGDHAFQMEFGTRFNVSTFARGLIYNNQLEFSEASSAIFRRLTGLNYFGKLHYRYYLSNNSYVGTQLYYQYIPGDFASNTNNISQTYTNYGMGFYYGYRF